MLEWIGSFLIWWLSFVSLSNEMKWLGFSKISQDPFAVLNPDQNSLVPCENWESQNIINSNLKQCLPTQQDYNSIVETTRL